jgi:hypothetical protein
MSIYNARFLINTVYRNILKQKNKSFGISGACSMNGGDEYAKCKSKNFKLGIWL